MRQWLIAGCAAATLLGGATARARADVLLFDGAALRAHVTGEIFGSSGDRDSSRAVAERRLRSLVGWFDQAVPLSAEQRRKLEAAGMADIGRFFAEYDACLSAYPPEILAADPQVDYSDLQRRWAEGLHGPDSLFRKIRRTVFSREELNRIDAFHKETVQRARQEYLRKLTVQFDASMTLSEEQRTRIRALLTEKVVQADVGEIPDGAGFSAFMGFALRIPLDDWAPIVGPERRREVRTVLIRTWELSRGQ